MNFATDHTSFAGMGLDWLLLFLLGFATGVGDKLLHLQLTAVN
jgi:hypothetical protein